MIYPSTQSQRTAAAVGAAGVEYESERRIVLMMLQLEPGLER